MEIDGDHEQKLIQQQMEETRASLSTKLEALETQVADTVQTATDAVQSTKEAVAETVESVKESVGEIRDKVGDTVRSVASLFDVTRQAEERPWVVLGGAIGVGCLVGWYLPSVLGGQKKPAAPRLFDEPAPLPSAMQSPRVPPEPKQPSWVSKEISRLRGLAIGMVMGSVRDLAKQALPEAISARVAQEVDNLTPHVGGEVIHGQILPDLNLGAASPAPEQQGQPDSRSGSFQPHEAEKAWDRALAGGRSG